MIRGLLSKRCCFSTSSTTISFVKQRSKSITLDSTSSTSQFKYIFNNTNTLNNRYYSSSSSSSISTIFKHLGLSNKISAHSHHIHSHLYINKRYLSTNHQQSNLIEKVLNDDTIISPGEGVLTVPPTPEWIKKLPKSIQPYIFLSRLDKPIGTLLLLYPCLWSTALAANPGHLPDWKLMLMFGAGAFMMRSAGCVINDMADYKFDRRVERTKSRPLASSVLTHKQAFGLLSVQLLTSFGILLSFNTYTICLSMASVPIVILYPFMKRFTYYPQFVLGLAFNWGALVGYSAVMGMCDWSVVLPLYGAGITWTMVYDTIYAHMDKKDDVSVGVKSTALAFGDHSRMVLSMFSVATIALMTMTGYAASMPSIYYMGTALCATHLAYQMFNVNFNQPQSCMKYFISNRTFALIFLITIIISKLFQQLDNDDDEKDNDNNKLVELD